MILLASHPLFMELTDDSYFLQRCTHPVILWKASWDCSERPLKICFQTLRLSPPLLLSSVKLLTGQIAARNSSVASIEFWWTNRVLIYTCRVHEAEVSDASDSSPILGTREFTCEAVVQDGLEQLSRAPSKTNWYVFISGSFYSLPRSTNAQEIGSNHQVLGRSVATSAMNAMTTQTTDKLFTFFSSWTKLGRAIAWFIWFKWLFDHASRDGGPLCLWEIREQCAQSSFMCSLKGLAIVSKGWSTDLLKSKIYSSFSQLSPVIVESLVYVCKRMSKGIEILPSSSQSHHSLVSRIRTYGNRKTRSLLRRK